jgi:hypothetical protein
MYYNPFDHDLTAIPLFMFINTQTPDNGDSLEYIGSNSSVTRLMLREDLIAYSPWELQMPFSKTFCFSSEGITDGVDRSNSKTN